MSYMFSGCTNLKSYYMPYFNTSKVTNLNGFLKDCNNLTSLNLSNFDTSSVKDMSYIFSGCINLKSCYLYYLIFQKLQI